MEIVGLRIRSIFSFSFTLRKLALKCWTTKGRKSQEIEVTSTSEPQKTCLASESCLRKSVSIRCLRGVSLGRGSGCKWRRVRGTARVVGGSPLPGVNGNLERWALQGQAPGTPWVGAGTQSCGALGCRPCADLSPSEQRRCERGVSQLAFVGAALRSIAQVHVSFTHWAEKTLN